MTPGALVDWARTVVERAAAKAIWQNNMVRMTSLCSAGSA
jgi:hypothetical protein